MRLASTLLLLTAASLAASGLASAQERLRPIGTVTFEPEPAPLKISTFEINRDDSNIRTVAFVMERGAAEIRSFRVRYASGESERFSVRESFADGESTESFSLDSELPVRSVEIAYYPKGPVKITLLADSRRRPAEPPPPPPPRWTELGCNVVSLLGDNDDVDVPAPGLLSAIRLRAVAFDVNVQDLKVIYRDGTSERLSIRNTVPAESQTSPIQLPDPIKAVRRIELNYSAGGFGTRQARMCVDGSAATR